MDSILCEGCEIYFHPIFLRQYEGLVSSTEKLMLKLGLSDKFAQHPEVKLLKSIRRLITEIIPADPFASYFRLDDDLSKYKRVKKLGLPNRYRLFFRPVMVEGKRTIVLLWLGHPRKEGDKNDCYRIFAKMVANGQFSDSIQELLEISSPVQVL